MFQANDHVSSPSFLIPYQPVTDFMQCEWSEDGLHTRQFKLHYLHPKSLAALFPIQNDEGVDGGDGQGQHEMQQSGKHTVCLIVIVKFTFTD
jgi:hypothetical protein